MWSKKIGKIIIVILLLDISLLGAYHTGVVIGYLAPLIGIWKNLFVCGIFAGFLLCSAIIMLIAQRPKTTSQYISTSPVSALSPDASNATLQPRSKKQSDKQWLGENGRLNRWFKKIVLIWTLTIGIVTYLWCSVFLWQTGIRPAIQMVTTTSIDWFSPDSFLPIFIAVFFGSFWVMFPLMMYIEFMKSRAISNKKNNTKRR